MNIKQATLADLDILTELFNLYRLFQKQASDKPGAKAYLQARLENKEATVFIASIDEQPAGFALLYPSFTSVGMQRSWILNDLYVKESFRKQGVAHELLHQVIDFAKSTHANGVALETCDDNYVAQRLYEKVGFKKEENLFYYLTCAK